MPPPYSQKTYERNVLNLLKKLVKEQERTNELLGEMLVVLVTMNRREYNKKGSQK